MADRVRDRMCLNKRRFPTAREAVNEAESREKSHLSYVPLFVYFCPYSQDVDPHFHLTKKPPQEMTV